MQHESFFQLRRFSWSVLLLIGLASFPAFGGETSPETERNALGCGCLADTAGVDHYFPAGPAAPLDRVLSFLPPKLTGILPAVRI